MCGESNEINYEKTVLCSTAEKTNCLLLGESNEINYEKIVLCSTAEKTNCLLLIRSEKTVRLSWESKKAESIK